MRDLRELNHYRWDAWEKRVSPEGSPDKALFGGFRFETPRGLTRSASILRVLASAGAGWDHVSVSTATRTPTWEEMEFIKRKFFKPDETAFQLHVPEAQHLSYHDHCLHLWRPHFMTIPLPDPLMVAPPQRIIL